MSALDENVLQLNFHVRNCCKKCFSIETFVIVSSLKRALYFLINDFSIFCLNKLLVMIVGFPESYLLKNIFFISI